MGKLLLFIWKMVDPIYFFFTRLTYIRKGENIFRVRLTRYKGYTVILSDGTKIEKNDILLKIHLHNVKLLTEMNHFHNDFQRGNYFYHSVKNSLPELALYLFHHPKQEKIKGLIGITHLKLHKNNLGFDRINIKNGLYRKLKQLTLFPIYFLSTNRYRKNEKRFEEPVYFIMSKSILFEKHLSEKEILSLNMDNPFIYSINDVQ
ncbi:YkoP family protein [Fervidibacillus halotolerans]|uniref:YkoP-like domain-containing protein n=1 Tax=Fervidibacillus halotolerans TaxID=2980027 RepID=A0A9E8M0N1_9BACI|nr:hypothetical protein [Fervidibacillus halotolerans]WAA13313.1 hypothetical protein OE105_04100 [Fervidibacillus halotolerans]